MGTRNLTAVYVDGEYRIAQYGQWDGYPEGQGLTCLMFLRDDMDEKLFRERLRETRFMSYEEIRDIYIKGGADENGFITVADARKVEQRYPGLDRDLGASILLKVQNGTAKELQDSIEFAAKGLFCEWAYVIDLDKRRFEVYRGFSTEPQKPGDRFYFLKDKEEDGYGCVRLLKSWDLDDLPSDDVFVAQFAEED